MGNRDEIRMIVAGLGNIGRRFLAVVESKREDLQARYGIRLRLVGAADSKGAAVGADGLDIPTVVSLKENKQSAADYVDEAGGRGYAGMPPLEVVQQVEADVLCEATPVNLKTGEPGLGCIRAALDQGMHVVTANKGPLVLAYGELIRLAQEKSVAFRFCGTVCGGLPAVNLGQRDLAGATIARLEALPNLTTSFILEQMAQGQSYAQALMAAQAQGCAEADPSLDVEGWDAANKLVILANSVLGAPATLSEVAVQGITGVTHDDLKQAKAAGKVVKLVASAIRRPDGTYALTVAPTPLPAEHPLARLGGQQMGIVYHTDIYGTISAAIVEDEPIPSAAAMLRDVIGIYT